MNKQKTPAHRRFEDNVEKSVKISRVQRMNEVHRSGAEKLNEAQIGQHQLVLIEGVSTF